MHNSRVVRYHRVAYTPDQAHLEGKKQLSNSQSQLIQGTEVSIKLNRRGNQEDVSLVRGGVFLECSGRCSPHATLSSRDQLQAVGIRNITESRVRVHIHV
jgi:hypothetical protein